MRYMLDTDICIKLLRAGSPEHLARLQNHDIDEIAISCITIAELQHGVAKSARPAHHGTLLAQFCAPFAIIPFDQLAAEVYGTVRTSLERAGTPIGPLDTLIASHAIACHLILVTNNEREFRRVPGLRVENWMAS